MREGRCLREPNRKKIDLWRYKDSLAVTKERRKPAVSKGVQPASTTGEQNAGMRNVVDRQRATQLLAVAKTRDLTPDEMKMLSVVQLSEYATIRQKRTTETR
jgi:hypothetical protein